MVTKKRTNAAAVRNAVTRNAGKAKREKLSRWDSAEYLRSEDDIAAYFDAATEEAGDDPAYMLHVLNIIARAA